MRSLRILFVEDDHDLSDALVSSLRSRGHFVLTADSGNKALQLLDCNRVDVVVCDWMMSDGDGIELMAKVRGAVDIRETPMVLVSGAVEQELLAFAQQLGADSILQKPYSVDALCGKIDEALAFRQKGRPGDKRSVRK